MMKARYGGPTCGRHANLQASMTRRDPSDDGGDDGGGGNVFVNERRRRRRRRSFVNKSLARAASAGAACVRTLYGEIWTRFGDARADTVTLGSHRRRD